MFSKLHERLGTAGFVISIIALVAALTGGAYAASGGLTGKQKKEVEKIAKKYAGKQGSQGPQGPAGANGAKGDTGSKGDTGATGATGAAGAQGKEGREGQEGSPWTAGGTLPSEATETGTYFISGETAVLEEWAGGAISFPIPLEAPLDVAHVIFVPRGETIEPPAGPANCQNSEHSGSATVVNPEAAPGYLCIYEGTSENMATSGEEFFFTRKPDTLKAGAAVTGTILAQKPTGSPHAAEGTWAVTAP